MNKKWMHGFVIACLLSLFGTMPVIAENQKNTEEAVKAAYTDEQLKSFILANAGLYQVQKRTMADMKDMESDEQKHAAMETANQQMIQVLQQVGLTPDSYNAMGQSIQSDDQLQEKVREIAIELAQQEEVQ